MRWFLTDELLVMFLTRLQEIIQKHKSLNITKQIWI